MSAGLRLIVIMNTRNDYVKNCLFSITYIDDNVDSAVLRARKARKHMCLSMYIACVYTTCAYYSPTRVSYALSRNHALSSNKINNLKSYHDNEAGNQIEKKGAEETGTKGVGP